MSTYYLLAFLIVLAIPLAAVTMTAGAVTWARDSLDRAPVAGGIGVLLTLVAAGNLFVERRCGGELNRPVITAFVGPNHCRAPALAAVELVLLLAVATAVAVRAGELRR